MISDFSSSFVATFTSIGISTHMVAHYELPYIKNGGNPPLIPTFIVALAVGLSWTITKVATQRLATHLFAKLPSIESERELNTTDIIILASGSAITFFIIHIIGEELNIPFLKSMRTISNSKIDQLASRLVYIPPK